MAWPMLRIASVIVLSSCAGHDQSVTPPAQSGSITGVVQTSTSNTGIPGAATILRRSSGDSIASSASDISGGFRFSNLPAGAYRVSARLPPGYTVAATTDTAKAVSVTAGEAASVRFVATPITQVTDTVRMAKSDTVTLANGVRIVISLSAGSSPLPIIVRLAPTDSTTWGRPLIGPAVEVEFPGSATVGIRSSLQPQALASEPPVTIFYTIPVTGTATPPAQAAVRGLFNITGSGNIVSGNLESLSSSLINPLTGTNQTVLSGQLQLTPGELEKFRLAIMASTLTCPDQFDLSKEVEFTGAEPLVLIHGIQLQNPDCQAYAKWNPATKTFKELIAALKANPTIRSRYTLYVFKYPDIAGVDNAARALASKYFNTLTKNGTVKVTIIAHSMGGLVARRLLKLNGAASIGQVITLATPHLGTPLANAEDIYTPIVADCLEKARNAPPPHPPIPSWGTFKFFTWFNHIQTNTKAIEDLKTTSTLLDNIEPAANLFSTFEGERPSNGSNHDTSKDELKDELSGIVSNTVMTAGACYLASQGSTPNDGFVPKSSSWPSWSPRKIGPFPRDHIQMTGADAQGVNDGFLPTIINYLVFPPTNPPPVLLLVSGNNQVGAAGQPLPQPITVEARTAQGSVLPNVIVQFATSSSGGSVTPETVSTDNQGRAVINWTLGTTAGIQTIKATIGGYATATISAYAVTTGGTGCPNFTPYILGTTVVATLTTADCTVSVPPDPARYYEKDYAAAVPQSLAIQVRMTSTAFVPWATVHIDPSGWSFGVQAPAGSQTATTNALVAPGAFAARALAANSGQIGSFTFTAVAVSSDVTGCTPFVLTSGVATTQQLVAGDCNSFGRVDDRYLVGIPPGWSIAVNMISSTLDAFLQLYQFDNQTFVVQDNNSGGGTNARLNYTSPTNSSYYLRATSASGAQLGQYSLTFTLVPPTGSQAGLRAGTAAAAAGVIPAPLPSK